MTPEPFLMAETLSSISQVVATIMSIYIVVLIFVFQYLWQDKKYQRNTSKQRRKTFVAILLISLLIVSLTWMFLFPSRELGIWSYVIISFILLYNFFNAKVFLRTKKHYYLETGIVIFSALFAIASFILGFYLVMSGISLLPTIEYLNVIHFFKIVKLTRLFLVLTLISFTYLISFIIIHKLMILKRE